MTENTQQTTRQNKRNVKTISTIVISAIVICAVVIIFAFTQYWHSGMKPVSDSQKAKVVHVPAGSTTKQIGNILEDKGLIRSSFVFEYYAKTHDESNFQAGYYTLSPNMGVKKLISTMEKGSSSDPRGMPIAVVTIPEGYTVEQVADLIAKNTSFKKKEFLALMKNADFYQKMANKYSQLLSSEEDNLSDVRYYFEGYLFPATYNLYEGESLKEFVESMVAQMNKVMKPYYQQIEENGMTVQQVLTLASLVEKEGVKESDRRNIAQVFLNRIKAGMPLQSDITVLYAMNKHKVNLSIQDTKYDSPYNLYINRGYGPGPFNNPSKQAIDAVVYPTKNDYLYFLADVKTGKVYFAKTYQEHLQLSKKYIDSK